MKGKEAVAPLPGCRGGFGKVQAGWLGEGGLRGGAYGWEAVRGLGGNVSVVQSKQTAGPCRRRSGMAQPVQEVWSKAVEAIFNRNTLHFPFCFSEKFRFPYIQANTPLIFTAIVAYATRMNVATIKPIDLIP